MVLVIELIWAWTALSVVGSRPVLASSIPFRPSIADFRKPDEADPKNVVTAEELEMSAPRSLN